MRLIANPQGGYFFLTGIAPYSSGVVALPGYEIVHVTLHTPLPYRQGFTQIAELLEAEGQPRAALCATQLRIPEPLSFEVFTAFNAGYRALLEEWDLLVDGLNPLARTNVAPAVNPPAEATLYAFSYTVPAPTPPRPTFIVAGAGDLIDQSRLEPAAIVRAGETSDEAMLAKVAAVMDTMQARLDGLGVSWADVTSIGVYTARPLEGLLEPAIFSRVTHPACHEVVWYYSRPPITGLEFEMDLRGVQREVRL